MNELVEKIKSDMVINPYDWEVEKVGSLCATYPTLDIRNTKKDFIFWIGDDSNIVHSSLPLVSSDELYSFYIFLEDRIKERKFFDDKLSYQKMLDKL